MISIEEIDHLLENKGAVLDSDGDKIGKVEQVFVGDKSHEPQWVTAKTGLFGHSETFIPLEKASIDGTNVRVPYDKAMIKDAPRTDDKDGHLDPDQEAELYRYYGLNIGGQSSANDDGEGAGQESWRPSQSEANDSAAVASPHAAGDAGGVRLRKYKVRENVTMTVPVEREEVRVVQEPPAGGAAADAGGSGGQEKSEGFGHNEYDQLRGPQSEDLEHPRGTAEQNREPEGHNLGNAEERNAGSVARDTNSGSSTSHGSGGQEKSEGFGHNEYDQLRGPQSEDLQHPRGTAEERRAGEPASGDTEGKAAPGKEDPPAGTHGRHAR